MVDLATLMRFVQAAQTAQAEVNKIIAESKPAPVDTSLASMMAAGPMSDEPTVVLPTPGVRRPGRPKTITDMPAYKTQKQREYRARKKEKKDGSP